MKLLIDMNLSPRWVDTLANAGIDSVHWSEVVEPKAPDRDIMAFARKHCYVVLTHDLDFGAILAATHGAVSVKSSETVLFSLLCVDLMVC